MKHYILGINSFEEEFKLNSSPINIMYKRAYDIDNIINILLQGRNIHCISILENNNEIVSICTCYNASSDAMVIENLITNLSDTKANIVKEIHLKKISVQLGSGIFKNILFASENDEQTRFYESITFEYNDQIDRMFHKHVKEGNNQFIDDDKKYKWRLFSDKRTRIRYRTVFTLNPMFLHIKDYPYTESPLLSICSQMKKSEHSENYMSLSSPSITTDSREYTLNTILQPLQQEISALTSNTKKNYEYFFNKDLHENN